MKGKLITDVATSDNEMIAIGTEVEIVDIRYGCEVYYMCIIPSGRQIMINANDIDITDYSRYIDWEQRRYEIAKEAVTAIMSNEDFCAQVLYEGAQHNQRQIQTNIAHAAVIFANALIEELKKGK